MGAGGDGFDNIASARSTRPPPSAAPPSAPPSSAPLSANVGDMSAVGSAPNKPMFADSAAPATLEQIVPAVDIEDISDDDDVKRKKRRTEILGILKLFGSNTALIVLVAGYCAVGGLIFNQIEAPNEVTECYRNRGTYHKALGEAVQRVDFLSTNLQLSDTERTQMYSDTMDQLRIKFQDSLWDTRTCETMVPLWSWMGSFFFCLTVVSTIGYGHIAPKTMWGRVVVMFYAVLGLPLMVMALASVGNVLAKSFKWLYNMACCCGCCVRHRKARVRIKPPAIMWRVNADGKPIGDGPSVLAEDSDSELEDENEVNIPLTVSLLVIATSLITGAIIFSNYENWPFLDAAYYSFVSLATIGFGDLVPNFTNAYDPVSQGKMIVTWVFLVFGMALVSMCLQMMQNEVVQKIKWLQSKFKMDKEAKEKKKEAEKAEKRAERKAQEEDDGVARKGDDDSESDSDTGGKPKLIKAPVVSDRPKTGVDGNEADYSEGDLSGLPRSAVLRSAALRSAALRSARVRSGVASAVSRNDIGSAASRPGTRAYNNDRAPPRSALRPVTGRSTVMPYDDRVKSGYQGGGVYQD